MARERPRARGRVAGEEAARGSVCVCCMACVCAGSDAQAHCGFRALPHGLDRMAGGRGVEFAAWRGGGRERGDVVLEILQDAAVGQAGNDGHGFLDSSGLAQNEKHRAQVHDKGPL